MNADSCIDNLCQAMDIAAEEPTRHERIIVSPAMAVFGRVLDVGNNTGRGSIDSRSGWEEGMKTI